MHGGTSPCRPNESLSKSLHYSIYRSVIGITQQAFLSPFVSQHPILSLNQDHKKKTVTRVFFSRYCFIFHFLRLDCGIAQGENLTKIRHEDQPRHEIVTSFHILSHRATLITISIAFWKIWNPLHEQCDLSRTPTHNLCNNICWPLRYPCSLLQVCGFESRCSHFFWMFNLGIADDCSIPSHLHKSHQIRSRR